MSNTTKTKTKVKREKKSYELDSDLDILAQKVIEENEDLLSVHDAQITYMLVYPNITKTVAGRCMRNNNENTFLHGSNYIVEFSGNLWDKLDDERKYILMLHELLHVNVTFDKEGNPRYGMADHDVQDFSAIVSKYGIDWIHQCKTIIASVNDLEPKDEKNISW